LPAFSSQLHQINVQKAADTGGERCNILPAAGGSILEF